MISSSSTNNKNEGVVDLGKTKIESYLSRMKQNNPTELLASSVFKDEAEIGPTDNLCCLPHFLCRLSPKRGSI